MVVRVDLSVLVAREFIVRGDGFDNDVIQDPSLERVRKHVRNLTCTVLLLVVFEYYEQIVRT